MDGCCGLCVSVVDAMKLSQTVALKEKKAKQKKVFFFLHSIYRIVVQGIGGGGGHAGHISIVSDWSIVYIPGRWSAYGGNNCRKIFFTLPYIGGIFM